MWSFKKPKPLTPELERPKYSVGDKVRIWPVFKNPVGRVHDIVEEKGKTFFVISYEYHDGRYFTERFEGNDLTLIEKQDKRNCNCGSNSHKHSDWCNKIIHPNGW